MKALKICGKVLLIIVIIAFFILIIGLLFLNFWPSIGDTPGREKQDEYAGRTEFYYDRQFHNGLDFEVMTGEASAKSDRNDGTLVSVAWEDNESVEALRDLVKDEPLTIQMSMYSTFEQVGSLGTSLPRNDVQTTTEAGDIVLYSGDQIVIFYGSNSWAYTRFGKITDKTASEMAELLGNGNISITISLE